MANDKLTSDPLHLEPLDLNNLDDFMADSGTKKESAVRRFMTGAKNGFLEQSKSRNYIRSFMRTALPDGYGRTIGVLDDTSRTLKQLGWELESTHYNELDQLTNFAQAQLPKLKQRTSDKLYQRLEDNLRQRREGYAAQREYSRDPEQARREREAEADERAIQEALNGSDQLAVELAVAQHESEAEYRSQEAEERGLRDQINKDRFDVLSRALGQITLAQQKQVAFQDQVTYRYQRKGLELQYRSYMALRDLRKMAEVQMKMHKDAYQALVTNTGLPDHMKQTKAESLRWATQQRMNQGLTSRLFGSVPELLASFAPSLAQNAKNAAGGMLQQLSGALSGAEGIPLDLLRQRYEQDRAGFVGSAVGRGGAMAVQRILLPMLARRARPGVTRASDKYLQGRHNQFSYMLDNAPALLQEYAQDPNNSNGMRGYLQSAIRALAPQFALNDRVGNGNYQTIGNQVAFNQLTQRSIVEIIPGYLARILHETRMMRTGDDSTPMETYDITRGEFTARSTAQNRLTKRIVGGRDTRNVSWAINNALDTYDSAGTLSPEARQALSERLLRDAATNRRFNPESYASREGYAAETSDKVVDELGQFFRSKFTLDAQGKMVANADNHRQLNDYSQAFINIRNMAADPIKEINRLLDTGNIGALREIGVVITVEGQDKINYPKLWELYRSDVSGTNPNPQAPQAPTGGSPNAPGRDRFSGLKAQMATATQTLQQQAGNLAGNARGLAVTSLARLHRVDPASLPGMAAIKQLSGPEIRGLLEHLPAVPEVNKQTLVGKLEQLKRGAQAQLTQAEQHVVALIVQHTANGLPSLPTMPMLPQGFAGPLALPSAMAMPDMTTWTERARDTLARLQGSASEVAGQVSEQVQDLYVKGREEAVLLAEDIKAGNLIDVTTQRIVQSVNDIHGAVIDKHGNLKLTAAQFREGLTDVVGRGLTTVRNALGGAQPLVVTALAKLRSRFGGMLTEENGAFSRVKDLYVENVKEPVLLARDMAKGAYLDLNTEKVIETIDDITGPVVDVVTQQVIVTAEEVAKGFTDVSGARVATSKMLRMAKSWAWFATRPVMLAARTAKWLGTKAFRMVLNRTVTRDAYLPGSDEPVLTARKLKRGEYYTPGGEQLTSFDDLREGVLDAQGQQVVSAEDVPNLINRDGTKHTAAKRRSAIRRLTKQALKGAVGGYWNATKRYYNWLGRKMDDPFNKRLNHSTGQLEEEVDERKLNTPTDALLGRILKALKDGLPGKEPAKNSWQAQLAAEEAEDAQGREANKAKRDERRQGPGALGQLLNLFKKRQADEDEDDDDTNLSVDLGDRGERGDKDGKGKSKKPRGRMGRAWDRIKGSRAGRVTGALGRGAGMLGRGALVMGADALLGAGAGSAIAGGLGAAGSALAAGGSAALGLAGSALAAGGGLLASILASPVLLGVGAAAAVGAGAYWLYSRNRDTSGDFRELRLLQYGSNSTSLSLKMLEVEKVMEGVTTKGPTPDWTVSKEVGEKVLDIMGVDKADAQAVAQLARWMDQRLKPVMMAYIAAVANLAQGSLSLNDLDDKFPEAQKGALLQAVKLPSGANGPYGCLFSPDGDKDPLEVTPAQIEAKFAELKDKFKAGPGAVTNPIAKAALAAGAGAANALVGTANADERVPNPVVNAQRQMGPAAGNVLATQGLSQRLAKASLVPLVAFNSNLISALQSIRMRAYGLDTVDTKNVQALLSAESYMYQGLSYNASGQAEWTGDAETLVQDLGPLFGVNPSDPSDADRIAFVKWVYYRFAPTFLAFASAVKTADGSVNTLDGVEKLSASRKVQIANAVMTATADLDGVKQSIWMQPHIFPGKANAEALKAMAKQDLALLNQEAEKEKVATPTQSAQQQAAKANGMAATGTTAQENTNPGFFSRMNTAVQSFGSSVASRVGNAYQGVKNFFGAGDQTPKTGINAGKPFDANTPTIGGPLAAQGNVYGGFASGTGGQFEQIPLPTSNKSRQAAMATLKAVQAMTGVDAELLATFCSIESGFDYLVKAGTSSATGWFQFIDGTWDSMLKKYGSKYGIPADDAQRSLRRDPRINALMGAEFLKSNYEYLAKFIGRAPTDVDLYCAHFMGPAGAAKFLAMDPNGIAALAFPAQARANMSIFYKGPGQPRTMREIYALFEEKVSKHRKGGGTNILLQKAANDASPVDAANAQAQAVASGATNTDTPDPKPQVADKPAPGPDGGSSAPMAPVSQTASKTAFPLTMPTGSTGSAAPVTSGATPPAANDAAGDAANSDPAQSPAVRAAVQADRTRMAQNQQHMSAVKEGNDLQARQLAVLEESRDYLKTIAQNLGIRGVGGKEAASNGMGKPTSGTPERTPGNTPMPISMSNK